MPDIGKQLADVPFDKMIENVAAGIANTQHELDKISLQILKTMSAVDDNGRYDDNLKIPFGRDDSGKLVKYSLLELGFTPSFYQFVDTVIEIKMAISMTESKEKSVSINANAVNASYCSKYQYKVEGSTMVRTKLVTLPAPDILEERVRQMTDNA